MGWVQGQGLLRHRPGRVLQQVQLEEPPPPPPPALRAYRPQGRQISRLEGYQICLLHVGLRRFPGCLHLCHKFECNVNELRCTYEVLAFHLTDPPKKPAL